VTDLQRTEDDYERAAHRPETIRVVVSYLPAAHPFERAYPPETTAETVRVDAMAFFHVSDRQERDTYRYFLELHGVRITNTSVTLAQLAAEHGHRHDLHFHLVEEITAGWR
jgi:hypothetical protein